MTIDERFERMERSLNRWRTATVSLLGVMVLVFVSGAVDVAPAHLKVRSLEVVDGTGNTMIALGQHAPVLGDKKVGGLFIKNPADKRNIYDWASLRVTTDGFGDPSLTMLETTPSGETVNISLNAAKNPGLRIQQTGREIGHGSAALFVQGSTAMMHLDSSQEGQKGDIIVRTTNEGKISPIVGLRKNGEPFWSAP